MMTGSAFRHRSKANRKRVPVAGWGRGLLMFELPWFARWTPTGAVVLAIGRCPASAVPSHQGILYTPTRSRRRPTTSSITEDIAMTSAVLVLALSASGLGHHSAYPSAQYPSKALPAAQAPTKCPPVPCKVAPAPCPPAPPKIAPCPQAPGKVAPCPQAPGKVAPCPQAPAKYAPAPAPQAPAKYAPAPAPQAPIKAAPQY